MITALLYGIGEKKVHNLHIAFKNLEDKGKLSYHNALQMIIAGMPIYDILSKHLKASLKDVSERIKSGSITYSDFKAALQMASMPGEFLYIIN